MTQTAGADSATEEFKILIIGSGFAGVCMAIRLKEAGIHSFTILERADDIGGTWRDNTYPGCACDVQSHVYSFSFELNPKWTRMFAPQPEIREYLKHCAQKYGVLPHVRYNENVTLAEYDDSTSMWTVRTQGGNVYRANVVVSGMGGLSNPAIPDLPGLEKFQGRKFHSATWAHDLDLSGKRVAVIGTGASAIQFVPQIAPRVAKLHLFQRTPPWIVPKPDRKVTRLERALFRALPFTQKLTRSAMYWRLESRAIAFVVNPKLLTQAERMGRAHIEKQIRDPELRRKVTPDYAIGCKRILLSDDYYPALARPNVEVVTDSIREVSERGVISADGQEREVDAIIFGTGFKAQSFVERGTIKGRDGVDLVDAWKGSMEAYKGSTVSGFPNFFFVCGPNTGLGHNSIIYMIESHVAYILDAIQTMRRNSWASVDVKPDLQDAYNAELQKKLSGTIWQSGCRSWYLDENGKNTTLWPDFTFRFRRMTASFDAANYRVSGVRRASVRGHVSAAQAPSVVPEAHEAQPPNE